jgi:hypothetical protein
MHISLARMNPPTNSPTNSTQVLGFTSEEEVDAYLLRHPSSVQGGYLFRMLPPHKDTPVRMEFVVQLNTTCQQIADRASTSLLASHTQTPRPFLPASPPKVRGIESGGRDNRVWRTRAGFQLALALQLEAIKALYNLHLPFNTTTAAADASLGAGGKGGGWGGGGVSPEIEVGVAEMPRPAKDSAPYVVAVEASVCGGGTGGGGEGEYTYVHEY